MINVTLSSINGNRFVENLGIMKAKNITTEEFKTLVFDYTKHKDWTFDGDLPTIIDFYADWCGPCKMVAPILDELSKEYDGKINIYKVDTEAEQELSSVFQIRSIPSMLFIPKGKEPMMNAGALPKHQLKDIIEKELLEKVEA